MDSRFNILKTSILAIIAFSAVCLPFSVTAANEEAEKTSVLSSKTTDHEVVGSLALQMAATNSVCGGATGTASVTVIAGGTAPYSYRWSNGATTPSVSGLAVGNYTVTVTDAAGNTGTSGVAITAPSNMTLSLASSPAACGSNTGMATVTGVTGGTAPYTYAWNNGGTTQTISNVRPSVYYVTVFDAAGCAIARSVEVQATNGPQIALTTNKADCNAANGSATITSVTGGTAPYTYQWSNGATTSSISNLSAGIYTVTVTDATGCSSVATAAINTNSNLVLTTASTPSVCGAATGTASVTSVTGGVAPYSYRWHNGGNTATITGLAPGTYFVTVSDAAGCTRGSVLEVVALPSFTVTTSSTNTICNGTTGTATVSVTTGGVAPFTYRWSNGATTSTATNLAASSYSVTVTDNAGCSVVATAQVNGTATNFVINTTSTASSCATPTGSATVTSVTGGNAPYAYLWSNGATTATISNVGVATYTVTITDGSGCQQSKQVVVAPVATISATLNSTATSCGLSTGSVSTATVTGGTAPYSYLWSNGATTSSITNVAGGTYTVTIKDANGCSTNATTTVKSIGNFVITTSTTPSACVGATGSATVTNVTGAQTPLTYKWSNGQTTQTATNLAAGTYTVTITDARGCEAVSGTVTVTANSPIAPTPSVTNATCGRINGQIAIAPAGGTAPFTYTWGDLTGTGQPATRTGLRPGTYSVTVNDASGCISSLSNIKIVDTGAVKAQFALQPQGCLRDSVIMRLTNNSTAQSASVTYSWLLTGNKTSTEESPDILYGGFFGEARLVVRSAEGCTDTLSLRFPLDNIRVDIPDTIVTCVNTRVSVTATNLNPTFPPRFKWSTGDSIPTTGVTPTLAGFTKIYVTMTNSYGCTKRDSVVVSTIPNLGTPDLSYKRDCGPKKINFFNSSPFAGQWRWVFGDPANPTAGSTANNPSYTYTNAGTFTVTLVPTSLTCLNTVTLTVNVSDKDAVIVDAGRDTTVCSSDRITLRATSNLTNFEWSNNRSFTPVSSTGATLLVTPALGSGIYYVRSKDTSGCIGVDSIVVNNRTIRIDRTATVDLCTDINKALTVTNLNAGDIVRVTWSPTSLITGFTNNDSLRPIIRANADGRLIGVYRNQYGCTLTDTITLKTHSVDAKATTSVKTIYINDLATLLASPTGTGFTYAWSPSATVTNPNSASTTASPKETTTYIVTVTDSFGCQDTAQVQLRVLVPECAEPYVFIPRAFSPNGDGTNEKVFVRGDYLTSMEFVIYNRWGEQVFVTKDRNEGWDGKHNGQPVCPDVYGYYVKGVCQKGEQFFKKGNITVLK
ncbi:MAG: gliding motility-associated C-terminal domain-containing protein [Saprospiraceae bacterium]|nr:gliding motility-associated C-terminal domain-containing protein [Saprospiraceae bacterium]